MLNPRMKLKARYKTVGPKKVRVQVTQAKMVDGSLIQEKVWTDKEMYMVYFPMGHSIRVDRTELVRLGFHKKPRLIDLETGDVIDIGGDPYDLENTGDVDVELFEEADPEEDINLRIERRERRKEAQAEEG